nr:hypothetical protein [Candidatus Sigynarchaeota archaeon]
IPEVVPIREHAASMIRQIRSNDFVVSDIPSTDIASSPLHVDMATFERAHGYITHVFTCTKTGETLEITENIQNQNAEHMKIDCTSQEIAHVLLDTCMAVLRSRGVQYIEGSCPVTSPELQRALVDAGLAPCGYLPAWTKNPRTGLYLDEIVFAWHASPFDRESANLTPKSARLASCVFT